MDQVSIRNHISIDALNRLPVEMFVLPEVYRDDHAVDEPHPLRNFLGCLHEMIADDPQNYHLLHSVVAEREPLAQVLKRMNGLSMRDACKKMVKFSGAMGLKKNCGAIRKLLMRLHNICSEDPKNFRILYLRTCERKRFEEMRGDRILRGLSCDTIRHRFDRMMENLPLLHA